MLANISISFALAKVVVFPVTMSMNAKKHFAVTEYFCRGRSKDACCSFFRSMFISAMIHFLLSFFNAKTDLRFRDQLVFDKGLCREEPDFTHQLYRRDFYLQLVSRSYRFVEFR